MSGTVWIRGEGGSLFQLDLPLHESIEDKLRKGLVHRVNADGSLYSGEPDDVPALPTKRPANGASKAVWIGWAVAQGCDPDDAAALTKTDLVEKYGAADAAPDADVDGSSGDAPAAEPPADAQ